MKAVYHPPRELQDIVLRLGKAIDDWSVPMEKISRRMLEDTKGVFASGRPEWPRMSEATIERWGPHPLLNLGGRTASGGAGTPLREWNERDWSKKNAAVINRAPHAHLMDRGVDRYQTTRYDRTVTIDGKTRKHRQSRAEVREHRKQFGSGAEHSPPREFLFFEEASYPTCREWLLDHIENAVTNAGH